MSILEEYGAFKEKRVAIRVDILYGVRALTVILFYFYLFISLLLFFVYFYLFILFFCFVTIEPTQYI